MQHLDQQRRLAGLLDEDDALLDALDGRGLRRDRHARGIAQHRIGELGDFAAAWWPRRTASAAAFGSLRDDLPDVVDEAHVEHAVGFVEHEHLDLVEAHRALLDEIEQAAGRGDQHVDAAAQARGPGG